jgi:hypothetical protein
MRMYEQADRGAPNSYVYSWILEAPYSMRKKLVGWRWTKGYGCRGSFVTKDINVAKETAIGYGLIITTNSTHSVIGAPKCIAA